MKLTDTQRVLLSAASQRDDHAFELPAKRLVEGLTHLVAWYGRQLSRTRRQPAMDEAVERAEVGREQAMQEDDHASLACEVLRQ